MTTSREIDEMEAKLRELASKEEDADTQDEFETVEAAYYDQLEAFCEALNTTKIITKGQWLPGGTYAEVETYIHCAVGNIGAQCVDLDRWCLHHTLSGFQIGYWSGNRVELMKFLLELDVLLGDVSADPQSEDRTRMKALGAKAHAMGVEKW